jgi:hypothetical protein
MAQRRTRQCGVGLDDRNPASLTISDLFRYLVGDDEAAGAREQFCDVVAGQLANVASWLGIDAWIGAGDMPDDGSFQEDEPDPLRRRSFIAVGLVAQISSELVSGALLLFRNGNEYSASALVRQLIECEYLLRAFRLNFADAARWHDANDSERWDFKPSKLREIGGFDRKEYANHCETGGHPHPAARQLLELPRKIGELERKVSGNMNDLDTIRVLWLDFAFHCDRTWRALTDLLSAEHARFERVGRVRKAVAAVAKSRAAWQEADILARIAKPILGALNANPTSSLNEFFDLED